MLEILKNKFSAAPPMSLQYYLQSLLPEVNSIAEKFNATYGIDGLQALKPDDIQVGSRSALAELTGEDFTDTIAAWDESHAKILITEEGYAQVHELYTSSHRELELPALAGLSILTHENVHRSCKRRSYDGGSEDPHNVCGMYADVYAIVNRPKATRRITARGLNLTLEFDDGQHVADHELDEVVAATIQAKTCAIAAGCPTEKSRDLMTSLIISTCYGHQSWFEISDAPHKALWLNQPFPFLCLLEKSDTDHKRFFHDYFSGSIPDTLCVKSLELARAQGDLTEREQKQEQLVIFVLHEYLRGRAHALPGLLFYAYTK